MKTNRLLEAVKDVDIDLFCLTDREKFVYKKRLENLSLEKIANMVKVTRERIRQIEAKAIKKLEHRDRLNKSGVKFLRDMDISVRTSNALRGYGIQTLDQLKKRYMHDKISLLKLRNFGKVSFAEVDKLLGYYENQVYISHDTFCRRCNGKLVPFSMEMDKDDGGGWKCGYFCECTPEKRKET